MRRKISARGLRFHSGGASERSMNVGRRLWVAGPTTINDKLLCIGVRKKEEASTSEP